MVQSGYPVTTTRLAPAQIIDDSPQLLYRRVKHQLTPDTIPFKIAYEYFDAAKAQEWLDRADAYPGFRQRKRTPARTARWRDIIRSGRFIDFLPVGALCVNDEGILLNGGNRLAGVVAADQTVGFKIDYDCPEWMFQYFDTGDKRTITEALHMNKFDNGPKAGPVARLGLRYEEFIFGRRGEHGWNLWGRHRDEHADINDYLKRREYVLDWIPTGDKLSKKANLQSASGTVFTAFQRLAWPDGSDVIDAFLDGLIEGAELSKGNPALTLREWGRNDGFIGDYRAGRREGHLLLLFQYFRKFANKHQDYRVLAAKGLPMEMPYHPDGHEVSVRNLREALTEMDDLST